jgi:hypothetical protein
MGHAPSGHRAGDFSDRSFIYNAANRFFQLIEDGVIAGGVNLQRGRDALDVV